MFQRVIITEVVKTTAVSPAKRRCIVLVAAAKTEKGAFLIGMMSCVTQLEVLKLGI